MENLKCPTCKSLDFLSEFGDTWTKHDVEILHCKKCGRDFTKEINEKNGKEFLKEQKSFPK